MRPHCAWQPSTQEDEPGVVMLEGRHRGTEDRAQMGRHELYLLLKWLQQSQTRHG